MGKAGKLIIGGVVGLIVVVAVVLTLLVSNLDSIVKRAIETVGSQVTGVPVNVGSVSISLQEGQGSISNLRVGNPRGFERGNALELETIALDLDVKNLSAELVRLESVLVKGATVNAIQGAGGNNLQAILDNLKSGSSSDSSATEDSGTETKLIIDDFQFLNGAVNVTIPKLATRSGKIPDIKLKGIGQQSNGVTAGEAARQILEPIMRQSISTVSGISKGDVEKMAKDKLNEALGDDAKKLGGFLNRGKD